MSLKSIVSDLPEAVLFLSTEFCLLIPAYPSPVELPFEARLKLTEQFSQ
jgi:hypothetical protein